DCPSQRTETPATFYTCWKHGVNDCITCGPPKTETPADAAEREAARLRRGERDLNAELDRLIAKLRATAEKTSPVALLLVIRDETVILGAGFESLRAKNAEWVSWSEKATARIKELERRLAAAETAGGKVAQ